MRSGTCRSDFARLNVDPALAEIVEAAPPDHLLEAILRLDAPNPIPPQFRVVSRFNRICTGRYRARHMWDIRQHPNVVSMKPARPLGVREDSEAPGGGAPWPNPSHRDADPAFTARGCIVAALDFGLDFGHPNFLNADGTTRLIGFWHQGADYDRSHPNRFGYGRQYSKREIDAALRTPDPYAALGYHPAVSDTGLGTHGTHTFDIAAGNGRAPGATASLARDAHLIFVHLATPALGTVGDLGDAVRLLEGLSYVDETAAGRPWVVNLSVGRTSGCHDGTSLVEQGMHELLRLGASSRAIIQSAGNYRASNLTVEGRLRDGERRDLEWIIDPADTTANEMDVWYAGSDRFVAAIRAPGAAAFTETPLGRMTDLLHGGARIGRIYHRRHDPNNHDNQIEVFLYDGAPPGTWTLRLIGEYVIGGRFHAWIERDLATPGAQSRFAPDSTSTRYTLGTIATSPLVITVGAYDPAAPDVAPAPFSSLGPTRDEREKPELLAPGVGIVAARSIPRGATRQEGLLIARSGTSMAAPHVTAVVAAMLEAAGRPVSIDVIRACLQASAEPLPDLDGFASSAWGRLDPAAAIRAIQHWADSEGDSAMTTESEDLLLDQAAGALQGLPGDRERSEARFLQRLLGDLGASVRTGASTPASVMRAFLADRPWARELRPVLSPVGTPSSAPDDPPRPGDWMLRAVPGTGDVGHLAIVASPATLTPSTLAAEGVAAESAQPGYYGLVIEAGAFPHGIRRRFARRLLDTRGRVPPHTLFLRPRLDPDMNLEPDTDLEPEGEDTGAPLTYENILERVRKELLLRFTDPDDPKLYERRKRLRALFRAVPGDRKPELRKRLGDKATSDGLSRLFHGRLAPPTRRELVKLLDKPSTGPAPSGPTVTPQKKTCRRAMGSITALAPWERAFLALVNERDESEFKSVALIMGPMIPPVIRTSFHEIVVNSALKNNFAITLESNVWFPRSIDTSSIDDLVWLVHESVHVLDYAMAGTQAFLQTYVQQAVATGFSHDDIPHEIHATRVERVAERLLGKFPDLVNVIQNCDGAAILEQLDRRKDIYRAGVRESTEEVAEDLGESGGAQQGRGSFARLLREVVGRKDHPSGYLNGGDAARRGIGTVAEDVAEQAAAASSEPPESGPLVIDDEEGDDKDVLLLIHRIQKPGDVAQYWADNAKRKRSEWAHPLSELERDYIESMTDESVPAAIRMRSPVDLEAATPEERSEARKLFGNGEGALTQYANYENRRRIMAHYVLTHPATVRMLLGLYRFSRDVNPVHFALERGWQIGSGKEMFTGEEVSRLGAAFEFTATLALIYGVQRIFQAVRPSSTPPLRQRRPLSLNDPLYEIPAEGGGMRINGRWYTEHALERMAPNTAASRAQVEKNILARLERLGIGPDHPARARVLARAIKKIDPRNIPPSEVEAEIVRRGSTHWKVVTARRGEIVVTVYPRKRN